MDKQSQGQLLEKSDDCSESTVQMKPFREIVFQQQGLKE